MKNYDVEIHYRGIFATRVFARDEKDALERAERELNREDPDAVVTAETAYPSDDQAEG